MHPIDLTQGTDPIILAMPHSGLFIPGEIEKLLNETGRLLADTDWNVDRLYKGLLPGATILRARFHRYVIDANRDPTGKSLYPGQNTTGLCPVTDFRGKPIYRQGCEPDDAEVERRRILFHAPYHAALEAEIARLRALHGVVVLYDCHSICSGISYLFEGVLPDFNIGSDNGKSCAFEIEQAAVEICNGANGYTSVVNGRFKGGWTTRHYGDPPTGIHAIQMELAQATYMEEIAPWNYDVAQAERIRPFLKKVLEAIADAAFVRARAGNSY